MRREKRDMAYHEGWWRRKLETEEIPGLWLVQPPVSLEDHLETQWTAYRRQQYYRLMWKVGGAHTYTLTLSR